MTDPFAPRLPLAVQTLQMGDHRVVFIDDFLADPDALVAVAGRSQFQPYPGLAERRGYPGLRAQVPASYSAQLSALMGPLVEQHFGVPAGRTLRKSDCALSLTMLQPDELGPTQRTPHFDASTPHHVAVLLYLFKGDQGGTAFYRHRATGLQQVTPQNREDFLDVYYAELDEQAPPPGYVGPSDDRYELLGTMPARFNRLVIYRGSLLHSGVIDPQQDLGTDPLTGRLTVNSFFDF